MVRILPLFSFLPVVISLKCTDMIIGNNNGTTFNFRNTLRCPETTKWCMSINGSFYSPQFSIDGRVGNCETNGFIGAIVERAKPIDLSCKVSQMHFSSVILSFHHRRKPSISACHSCTVRRQLAC
ncbi:hypothetical protein Y032_0022g630 [Ancylostoma ceylanicum]|uniref:Uncharacterized protein n=1 Tax=Ancylostoma ceylanicum TaxID=53326 RepID=A0A016UZ44_9BILA|nr:hypothetical protein Y032_0022g630 [Ancylostoma ceylanicum]